jgi:hypothetical protein
MLIEQRRPVDAHRRANFVDAAMARNRIFSRRLSTGAGSSHRSGLQGFDLQHDAAESLGQKIVHVSRAMRWRSSARTRGVSAEPNVSNSSTKASLKSQRPRREPTLASRAAEARP